MRCSAEPMWVFFLHRRCLLAGPTTIVSIQKPSVASAHLQDTGSVNRDKLLSLLTRFSLEKIDPLIVLATVEPKW